MKVSELIALLQQYPPDAEVFAEGDGGNYVPAASLDKVSFESTGSQRGVVMLHPQIDQTKRDRILSGGTQVFIDGVQVVARGVSAETSAHRRWFTIDADDMPLSGQHSLRVVLPNDSAYEFVCDVEMQDETGAALAEPRFYILDKQE